MPRNVDLEDRCMRGGGCQGGEKGGRKENEKAAEKDNWGRWEERIIKELAG